PVYSKTARIFHWLTALLVLIQFPIGLYMTYRGYEMSYVNEAGETKTGLFDATTGMLYDSHKLLGLLILAVVLWRLIYRLSHGAPPSDRSVPPALTGIGHLTHWLIYLLLIAVPIGGYLGVSYYGALDAFGLPLIAITDKDQKFSEQIFELHGAGAFALLTLVGLHLAAALYHRLVRKDQVVERMLPKNVA
ncbi:MAG: cytochrome b, partial [Hyphomicrobium sp.]